MPPTLFSYRAQSPDCQSALHSIAPLPKFLALFALCFLSDIRGLAFSAFLLFALSGFHLSTILRVRPVLAIGAFVLAVKVLSVLITFGLDWALLAVAARSGAEYCVTFFLVTLCAQAVFETTSFLELYGALESLPLIGKSVFPLMLVLSVSFIADVFGTFSKVKMAAASRGARGVRGEVQILTSALTALFFQALKKRQALLMRLNIAQV